MDDVKIDFNINEVFKELQSKISEIENNLEKLVSASIIEETFWNTKEFEIYNTEYLPYLKKVRAAYPLKLMNYLEFMKNAIEKYQEIDIKNKKES